MRLVAFLFTIFPLNSFALEVYTAAHGGQWTFHYNENSKWILETVVLDKDGWPRLESRQVSNFEYQGVDRLSTRIAHGVLKKSEELPEATRVLKGKAGEALWTVTNQWSAEWEAKYAEWAKSLNAHWWSDNGVRTDCADVAYSAKWIFARMNGLPMANRLAAGAWFTHESVKPAWMKLPTAADWRDDQRFRAALDYMLDFVFTHSLWRDSYPIAIHPQSLTAGAHHLNITTHGGHTQFVWQVGTQPDQFPLITLNGSIPRKLRVLTESVFTEMIPNPKSNALLKIRWPKWENGQPNLVDAAEMPEYSQEQFDPAFIRSPRTQFWEEVFFRVNPHADYDLMAARAVQQLVELFRTRIQVVEDGYRVCGTKKCVAGSAEWEEWSTPSRDQRITDLSTALTTYTRFLKRPEELEKAKEQVVLTQEGHAFTLGHLIAAWSLNLFSSDPNDDPVLRWGVVPRGMASRIASLFADLLAARAQALAKAHNCHGLSCTFGSPEYKAAATTLLDNRLAGATGRVEAYCQSFGAPLCAEVRTILNTLALESAGRTRTVSEWMRLVQNFNSDPRLDFERREFGYTKDFAHASLPMSAYGYPFKVYGKSLLLKVGRLFVIDGAHLTPWSPARDEEVLNLDEVSGWIYSRRGNLLLARKNVQSAPLTFGFATGFAIVAAYGNGVLVSEDSVLRFLRIENGAIHQTGALAGQAVFSVPLSEGFAIGEKPNGDRILLDTQQGRAIEAAMPGAYTVEVRRRDNGEILMRSTGDGSNTYCGIVRLDNQLELLNESGQCIGVAPKHQEAVVVMDGKAVLRKYRDWKVVSNEELGTYSYSPTNGIVLSDAPVGKRYYCLNSRGIHPVDTDGVYLGGCNDRYFIDATADGKAIRVRAMDDGRVIQRLTAENYSSFASPGLQESLVLTGTYDFEQMDGSSFGMWDIDHPEKFSLITKPILFQVYEGYRVGRENGIVVQEGAGPLWLAY